MSIVPLYLDLLGAPLEKSPKFLKNLGNLETKLLTYDICDLSIKEPVFIGGMARSGSTILLEFLNDHPQTCSYQYSDYPYLHANFFWNTIKKLIPSQDKKVERAHKDGIFINAQSPEALDEIIWMSFFDELHSKDGASLNTLDKNTNNQDFEEFYKNSLLKLLALRQSSRLAFKNNYYSARLPYLNKIFPDAKFIVPYRDPVEHVYSMLKQHKLICEAQKDDKRASNYMRRHGHFEFGMDFRPTNFGNTQATQEIINEFENGDFIKAFTLYWNETYQFIAKTLENHKNVQENTMVIAYDTLTRAPKETLQNIQEFTNLKDEALLEKWSSKIKKPDYYNIDLPEDDIQRIKEMSVKTEETYKKLCGSIST